MSPITVYPARRIITMNPMQESATHVAVRDGRVLAVGSLADMQAWGDFVLDERFAGRCPVAEPACAAELPPLREVAPGHWVRCRRVDVVDGVPTVPLQMPAA